MFVSPTWLEAQRELRSFEKAPDDFMSRLRHSEPITSICFCRLKIRSYQHDVILAYTPLRLVRQAPGNFCSVRIVAQWEMVDAKLPNRRTLRSSLRVILSGTNRRTYRSSRRNARTASRMLTTRNAAAFCWEPWRHANFAYSFGGIVQQLLLHHQLFLQQQQKRY